MTTWALVAGGENQRAAASDAPPASAAPSGDARLKPPKTLRESYFPFTPPATHAAWEVRSREVRTQILVAAGLWPEPERPKPRAVVHGRVDRDEYTVEKVILESYPGHFVTGNLYRPKAPAPAGERRPAVLSPYGHWPGGRFGDLGAETVEAQIAMGAETFPTGGRHPLQARCVQLARMGCIAFIYDLEGYADSRQLPESVSHRLASSRPEFEGPEHWGFFSTQAELRMQSVFGVQVYNGLCALDWLASLPDVDPARIGVTGGSGGATQTMMICGVDDRPAAAFEAVMVSTAMQGGCPCENACCLRVDSGNVEIAALMAPKPLGLASANDWTAQFHELGYPELQQLYRLVGAADRVKLAKLTQFPHNYNAVTREAMYEWFNEHLQLGLEGPVVERDYVPLSIAEMSVWDASHPAPPSGDEHERALVRELTARDERQLAKLTPTDAASLEQFREVMRAALRVLVGPPPEAGDAVFASMARETGSDGETREHGVVRERRRGAVLPVTILRPSQEPTGWVLWTDPRGKAGLAETSGDLRGEVRRLLDAGYAVVGVDVLGQGDCTLDGRPIDANRTVEGDRDLAAYTYGYNRTLVSQRAADLVSTSQALALAFPTGDKPALVAPADAAPWSATAIALAPSAFSRAAIDVAGFRFASLGDWRDGAFLPGIVKYGDLPGLLSLAAPLPIVVKGVREGDLELAKAAYAAANAEEQLLTVGDRLELSKAMLESGARQ